MNMPFVDKYDTQSPIELARQFVDYRGWYDKSKIVLKEVLDCGFVACMNPTAGSFNITPRMQRHFATFAMQARPRRASALSRRTANSTPRAHRCRRRTL